MAPQLTDFGSSLASRAAQPGVCLFPTMVPGQKTASCSKIGRGRVLIPSAFTPDGDGLNDTFFVVATPEVVAIDSFLIFDRSNFDTVFFAGRITDFSTRSGWDGRVGNTVKSGTFEYTFVAPDAEGQQRRWFGLVCSLPCPSTTEDAAPDAGSSCVFASQLDSMLRFDVDRFSGETLPCY